MAKPARRYLDMRGLKWWFKRDIPAAIRGHFQGRTAYLVNLETSDLRLAQKRRDAIARETDRLFADARAGRGAAPDAALKAEAEHWAKADAATREEFDTAFDHAVDRMRDHDEKNGTMFVARVYGRVPLDDALEQHLSEITLRPKSKQERRAAVKELAEWARPKSLIAADVRRREAATYFEKTILPLNRKTAAKRLSNLKQYWDWLVERGHVEEPNPWAGLRLPAERKGRGAKKEEAERPFTDDEVVKLFTAEPEGKMRDLDRLRDAMVVAALSGLRIEEMCQLTLADCADNVFTIQEGKTASAARNVPIHPALGEIVRRRSARKLQTERLFSDVRGQGQNVSDPLSKQFGRFIRDVGVADLREGHRRSKVNFHSFRRWFITKAEQAGQPPHIISTLVGHAEGRKGMTLGVYSAGPSSDQLRTCVEAVRLPAAALRGE